VTSEFFTVPAYACAALDTPITGGHTAAQMQELRRESLLTELHQRIRDIRQGPDGLLYVITDSDPGARTPCRWRGIP